MTYRWLDQRGLRPRRSGATSSDLLQSRPKRWSAARSRATVASSAGS